MIERTKNTVVQLVNSPNGMFLLRLFIAAAMITASLLFPESALAGPTPGGTGN